MKNHINKLLILLLSLVSSCSDFLDKNPPSEPSESVFWLQKSDFEMALASCYGIQMNFGNGYFSWGVPLWDTITDNARSNDDRTTYILQGNIDPSTTHMIPNIYQQAYQAIARMNIFLYQLEHYNNTDITIDEKNQMKGQVLFLRAFYYTYLYRCFGHVPLVTEPLDLETQYQPKVDKSLIIQQILLDLDDAASLLPDVTYSEFTGKVTRGAALAMKMRMLLYDAYDNQGIAITSVMTQVLTIAEQIKGYYLSDCFEDIFQGDGQENNPEIIFSFKFLAPNLYHEGDMWFGARAYAMPLTNFVEQFEFNDGTPFSKDSPLYNPENPIENRDPRMDETVFYKQLIIDGAEQPISTLATGYGVKKVVSRDKNDYPLGYNSRSDYDCVHLRYADVLLMIAEAENEVNGPTEKVYEAINSIRGRAGIEMPPLPDGLSKDEMRVKIRHERRIELAYEGSHYFDLKRWRTIGDVLNNLVEPTLALYKAYFEDRFYLWPLPQSEIDKNNGVLIQNPDYK